MKLSEECKTKQSVMEVQVKNEFFDRINDHYLENRFGVFSRENHSD